LHGVTRPVAFDVVYNHSYARHPFGRPISQLGFSARGVIRRSDFGITQFLPEPGTQAGVGDDVELVIEAEFVRPIAG
jgi:polyisoprenoid-binding protein YceI